MRGPSSAPGHQLSLSALRRVFSAPWNTWSQVPRHKASSQLHRKKGLLDKSHFSKWRGHAKAEVIALMEWKQRKQIANTETDTGNVWLHSKLRPIYLPSFCMWSLNSLCLSLCALSPPRRSLSSLQNSKSHSIFSISAYHLFTLLWNFQVLPPLSFHLSYLVFWKIFSSLSPTGHVETLRPTTNSRQHARRTSQPRYLQQ